MNVQAATHDAFAWFQSRTGYALSAHARGIEARSEAGAVRGVVAFDSWTPSAAHVHVALASPIVARHLMPHAFEYPFRQLGLRVLLGFVPAHHARSWRFAQSLGFRQAYRVVDGWAQGDDLVVYELRRERCRFLKESAA